MLGGRLAVESTWALPYKYLYMARDPHEVDAMGNFSES